MAAVPSQMSARGDKLYKKALAAKAEEPPRRNTGGSEPPRRRKKSGAGNGDQQGQQETRSSSRAVREVSHAPQVDLGRDQTRGVRQVSAPATGMDRGRQPSRRSRTNSDPARPVKIAEKPKATTSLYMKMMGEKVLSATIRKEGPGNKFWRDQGELAPDTQVELVNAPSNWIVGSHHGRTCYINKVTGSMTFDRPKGVAGEMAERALAQPKATATSKQGRSSRGGRGWFKFKKKGMAVEKSMHAFQAGKKPEIQPRRNSTAFINEEDVKKKKRRSSKFAAIVGTAIGAIRFNNETNKGMEVEESAAVRLMDIVKARKKHGDNWDGVHNVKNVTKFSEAELDIMAERLASKTPRFENPLQCGYIRIRKLHETAGGRVKMYIVRKVEDTGKNPKQMLLKTLAVSAKKERQRRSLQVRQVMQEMKLLAMLNHPYLPEVYEMYEHNPRPGIHHISCISEFMAGGELCAKLEEADMLSEKLVRDILKKLLQVLHYLHQHGIVHNDIKPENVCLVDPNDVTSVKLIDFDCTVVMEEDMGIKRFSYSPQYKPPEAMVSTKGDIYSLGVLAYVALTGYFPPAEEYDWKIYWFGGSDKFLSDACKDILTWMLYKDDKIRPSAIEVLEQPWIESADVPNVHLASSQRHLAILNRQRRIRKKLKAQVKAMGFVRRISKNKT